MFEKMFEKTTTQQHHFIENGRVLSYMLVHEEEMRCRRSNFLLCSLKRKYIVAALSIRPSGTLSGK